MTKLIKLTALLLPLVVWMSACDEGDDPPQIVPTGLEILEAPETMLANIDSIYTIRCRVADDGVNPEYILCEVTLPDDRTIESFRLYDDGSVNTLPAHPYAGEHSGDIVPSNDTYTRTVNGRLLTIETGGNFLFTFSVPGQTDAIYTKLTTIPAANIEECIITEATDLEISGMVECFDTIEVDVTLSRTEPDVIDSVWGILTDYDDEYKFLLTPSTSDTFWTATVAPTTFPCLRSGVHHFKYAASTRFGMYCELDMGTVGFMNDVQTISEFHGLPDSLERPQTADATDTIAVTLKLNDCNLFGVLGFNGVRFDYKREPYDWSPHNPEFRLNDNGVDGDTTAGDGTYTVGLTFSHSDSLFNNIYIFRYYSVECAHPNEQTDYLYDTVRVWQDTTLTIMDIPPSEVDDIGFRVLSSSASGGSR